MTRDKAQRRSWTFYEAINFNKGILMKKPCKVAKLLSSFLDGELSQKQTAFVRQHLKTCLKCQKEFESLQSVDHMLLGLKEIEPSKDFTRSFWQKADEIEAKKSNRSLRKYLYWGWRPSFIAATAVLFIISGVMVFQKLQHPSIDSAGILIAENLEFYSDLEVINRLELLENWDAITAMDDI
jgi:hypothetical protein